MDTELFTIGGVSIPVNTDKSPYVPEVDAGYILDSDDEEFAKQMLGSIKKNKPILLIGPTGCGKTATIKFLAGKTGNSYRRMQLNGATNTDNFVGRWGINDTGTVWTDGILVECMKKGYWLILDELNMALPEICSVLNSVLDDDRSLTIDDHNGEVVRCHPNFRIFAAMNPSEDYTGTKELNAALKNRFSAHLRFDYPKPEKEIKIICSRAGMSPTLGGVLHKEPLVQRMVQVATVIRDKVSKDDILVHLSTRQLIDWAILSEDLGIKTGARLSLVNSNDPDYEKILMAEIDKAFKNAEDISFKDYAELEAKEIKKQEKRKAKYNAESEPEIMIQRTLEQNPEVLKGLVMTINGWTEDQFDQMHKNNKNEGLHIAINHFRNLPEKEKKQFISVYELMKNNTTNTINTSSLGSEEDMLKHIETLKSQVLNTASKEAEKKLLEMMQNGTLTPFELDKTIRHRTPVMVSPKFEDLSF